MPGKSAGAVSAAVYSAGGTSIQLCFHAGVNLEMCCKTNRTAVLWVKMGEGSHSGVPDQWKVPRYELRTWFYFSSLQIQSIR